MNVKKMYRWRVERHNVKIEPDQLYYARANGRTYYMTDDFDSEEEALETLSICMEKCTHLFFMEDFYLETFVRVRSSN